jgi:intein/homing endonuclease
MDLNYISGFFDADGSITLSKESQLAKYRHLKLDFTNVELTLLLEMKEYLATLGVKTYISTKPAKKESHQTSYTLAASDNAAVKLCELLSSRHPKKLHRINCINKYYKQVTMRNGKYSSKQHLRKLAFERLFFLNFR